jgi:hypothetical protein
MIVAVVIGFPLACVSMTVFVADANPAHARRFRP